MSYCRFSDDNFASDVYCYAGNDGIVIHVAQRKRITFPGPTLTGDDAHDAPALLAWYRALRRWQETDAAEAVEMYWSTDTGALAARVPLTIPDAGRTFTEPTAHAAIVRLAGLRARGARVPDHAFAALADELAEETPCDDAV